MNSLSPTSTWSIGGLERRVAEPGDLVVDPLKRLLVLEVRRAPGEVMYSSSAAFEWASEPAIWHRAAC